MSSPDDHLKYQSGEPLPADQIEPGVIVSPDVHRANRIPPGQSRTRKWPVLHYGRVPHVRLDEWRLEIFGLVERLQNFTWEQFNDLPRAKVHGDFHCVTRWSRLGNTWEGVSTRVLLDRAGIRPQARFVILHGYDDGWITNLPLDEFIGEDALLATHHDGLPLSAEHGGPVRAVVPRLYAWKSAKWIKAIELVADDRAGYWERCGYHMHGDPWTEKRFGP